MNEMTQPPHARGREPGRARYRRIIRTAVRAGVALAVFAQLSAQPAPLKVERAGDRLRVAAPQLHFLSGPALDRLHDGASVTFVLSVELHVERGRATGARETRDVVFSYDLWEERFSVAQVGPPGASASHLTAAAAEAWCVDLLSLPSRAAPASGTFVVKLECSLRDGAARPAEAVPSPTLTGLIDMLSRKARAAPPRWEAVSPPLRLADLKDQASK